MSDVRVTYHGSVVGFQPLTPAAVEFFQENVESASWQWMGPVLYVDARMAMHLAEGIEAAGFRVQTTP